MTTVSFGCKSCGLERILCTVPSRGTDQPLEEWLAEVVSPALGRRHRVLSLFCESNDLDVVLQGLVEDPNFMVVDPGSLAGGEA